MFGFFKKNTRSTETKLYADLKPGERILKIFTEHIVPLMNENGFVFKKKEFSFIKKFDSFTQHIHVRKSKWNQRGEVCSFSLTFMVNSEFYSNWLKETYGNEVGGTVWYIEQPFWDVWTKDHNSGYDLEAHDNLEILEDLKYNLTELCFPFMNNISDFKGAADFLYSFYESPVWELMIVDFYFIAGEKDLALKVLYEIIDN